MIFQNKKDHCRKVFLLADGMKKNHNSFNSRNQMKKYHRITQIILI